MMKHAQKSFPVVPAATPTAHSTQPQPPFSLNPPGPSQTPLAGGGADPSPFCTAAPWEMCNVFSRALRVKWKQMWCNKGEKMKRFCDDALHQPYKSK